MISEDMQNNIIVAAVIVIAMFISMRALYGYWPWQTHPKLHRVHKEPDKPWPKEGFDFQPATFRPVPMESGIEPDPTEPPFPPIGGSVGYKPPLVVEIRHSEDHFDRGYNDNG